MVNHEAIIQTVNLNCYYGDDKVIKNLDITVAKNEILGIIGPANSGKTTFLRALNRLNYLNPTYSQKGAIIFENQNAADISDNLLRKKIGIIFELPQVLPLTIYQNVAYGPKVHGITNKSTLDGIVETALKRAYLWERIAYRSLRRVFPVVSSSGSA